VRAAETFRHPNVWSWLVQHDMQEDVSWSRSALKYVQLYLGALAAHREKRGVVEVGEPGSPAPAPVGP
jgi:glycogen synthase